MGSEIGNQYSSWFWADTLFDVCVKLSEGGMDGRGERDRGVLGIGVPSKRNRGSDVLIEYLQHAIDCCDAG